MYSSKRVFNMKHANTRLNNKPLTSREKKFRGPKRNKFTKGNKGNKIPHPRFKDLLRKLDTTIIFNNKDKTKAFKDKNFEKLYECFNMPFIDCYVLLKPKLLTKIIRNPMWYINKKSVERDKISCLEDIPIHSAVIIFKSLWLKEIPFNELLPDGMNIWNGTRKYAEIDITSQKVRRVYNEELKEGLKETHLSEQEQADICKLLDSFIFEYSFGFSKRFRKPELNLSKALKAISPLGLF